MLRRGRAAVVALVPALIITWACQREVDSRTGTVVDAAEVLLMESASSAYLVDTAGGAARVEVVIVTENPTDGPIYLARCGPDTPRFVVERLAGDIWDVAMTLDCPPAATPIASDARPDTATQLPEVERRSGAFELRTR